MATDVLEYPIGWRMQKGPCMPKPGWEIDATPGKQSIHIDLDCYKTSPCRHRITRADGSTCVMSSQDVIEEYSDRDLLNNLPIHFKQNANCE